jgi:hypothetical protein
VKWEQGALGSTARELRVSLQYYRYFWEKSFAGACNHGYKEFSVNKKSQRCDVLFAIYIC